MRDLTADLAAFLAAARYESLPPAVVDRAEELFLDWFASALAGRGARPTRILESFARTMGPACGAAEVLTTPTTSSPFFAALVNGAASHVVEQDDLHNSSVLHPATVVFPAVLAAAQDLGASGRSLIAASTVGYEAAIRCGQFLGRSHYKVFHTTGTAGTIGAAAGVAHVLGLDTSRMQHALGSAGTQAAGLWEFLRDAADSKQLHTAKAAANGLLSAYIARDGFTGARRILEGPQGMGAAMSDDPEPDRLVSGLGDRWALTETSFKVHASCRHTHPAADALLALMAEHRVSATDIAHVTARVHQPAIDVLGPVIDPRTIHQSKFSMGFVLALVATRGRAGLADFTDEALTDPGLRAFHDKVTMELDPEIDAAYPGRWMGRVVIATADGRTLSHSIPSALGDPDNTLSRAQLADKALRLAVHGGGVTPEQMARITARVWRLRDEPDVRGWLVSY
jgi:2-methylcitrate dehydratase PrpD